MKKFLVIVGSLLVLLALVLVAGALYGIHTAEKDRNRRKMAPAQGARWKKKDPAAAADPEDPGPEDEPGEEVIDTPFTVVKEEPNEKAA